jgi:hypothetical protein
MISDCEDEMLSKGGCVPLIALFEIENTVTLDFECRLPSFHEQMRKMMRDAKF